MGAADGSRSDEMSSRSLSVAQSITYFRISAVASFICGIGCLFVGMLTLSEVSERVFLGMGLSQIALGLVLLALCVACLQLVARLRARQRNGP